MSIKKSLDEIRHKLAQLSPENQITGLMIDIVDRDESGDIVIVSRQSVPFCTAGGEAWQEDYPPGDPRRVKWVPEQ